MRVSVVGAGALGRVYGALLETRGRVDVSFVERTPSRGPFVLEAIGLDRERLVLSSPRRTPGGDPTADVIVLAVRAEQLDDALSAPWVRESASPLVCLTPLLPAARDHWKAAFAGRLTLAMPAVAAHQDGDVTRFWSAPFAATSLEPPRGPHPAPLDDLVAALARAGLGGRYAMGTEERNPALTITCLPLMMAVTIAAGLPSDARLLSLVRLALTETARLATRVGPIGLVPWLARMLARPLVVRALGALGRTAAPELVAFIEDHFGRKLAAQNASMARDVIALASQKGHTLPAFEALDAELRKVASTRRGPPTGRSTATQAPVGTPREAVPRSGVR